jgi:acyl-coenzyme A synthetase/AMP-(fatty) acid ligase
MWLWESLQSSGALSGGRLLAEDTIVRLEELERASLLGQQHLERLRGKAVFLSVANALTAALAFIELDGLARRVVLAPPGLDPEHLPALVQATETEVWLGDSTAPVPVERLPLGAPRLEPGPVRRHFSHPTEWVLLSSGTAGVPKPIAHTLETLEAPLKGEPSGALGLMWSTFYDIRRYGGLQILLRALHSGSLLLRSGGQSLPEFLALAARLGITHMTGTPSHWRAALMSGAVSQIAPRYVRLSGEIADQGILDNLDQAFPRAQLVHAFASSEAGLAFEVHDRQAGFAASLLSGSKEITGCKLIAGLEIKLQEETLRIRSPATAVRYLGDGAPPLHDRDGFVDTGDRVQLRDERAYFVGRAGGIINVGGLKVHPEEVEAIINTHPGVRISRVTARRSPITGALVIAEVVASETDTAAERADDLVREILELCRKALPAHKVPARVQLVPHLPVSAAGKLVRSDA